MKKLLLLGALCTAITLQLEASLTLSKFKFWNNQTGFSSNELPLSPDNMPQSFCIIIPDAPKPIFMNGHPEKTQFAGQDIKFFLGNTQGHATPITIPKNFLNNRVMTKPTTVLILDWVDTIQKTDTDKIVSETGTEIIKLMTEIPRAEYMIVGLGRGGTVATGIINQEDLPKKVTLILLGTPFAQDTDKYPTYATLKQHNINTAFIFYNNIPYRGSPLLATSNNHPAKSPENTYHLRTIANNKEQPIHKISFLKLQDVLNACAKTQQHYRLHHELWVSFSNIKPNTNGLVGILKNTSSDTPQSLVSEEKDFSNKELFIYKNAWGSTNILSKSDTTPIRSTYKLESRPTSKKLASKST